MIEDRLAHLVTLVPPSENAKVVVTRGGKTTRDPPTLTMQEPRKARKRVKIATTSC
jgi:hypothetical protein